MVLTWMYLFVPSPFTSSQHSRLQQLRPPTTPPIDDRRKKKEVDIGYDIRCFQRLGWFLVPKIVKGLSVPAGMGLQVTPNQGQD